MLEKLPTSQALKADGLLVVVALIWGSTFVAQRSAAEYLGSLSFNAARYSLGLLCVALVLARTDGFRSLFHFDKSLLSGMVLGGVLFLGSVMQQAGIADTTAGKAGFITGLYVVIVPVMAILSGISPNRFTSMGIALSVIGLYFLSVEQGAGMSRGDALVLLSAFCWAGHVVLTSRYAKSLEPIRLAYHQFLTTALLSIVAMVLFEPVRLAALGAALWPLLYAGILSTAIAFTLQIRAQQHAPPSHAALIMSLETVFAAFCGWLVLDETLTVRDLVGCVFMLLGIVVSQLHIFRSCK